MVSLMLVKQVIVQFVLPISVGFTTVLINLIQAVVLIKKSSRKSPFEIILLSLAFADLFSGAGALLIGTVDLLHLLQSTVKSGLVAILGFSGPIIIAFSVWTSLLHVLLIAIERFTAVYFPLYHRIFISKRRNSTFIISVVWTISVVVVPVYYFRYKICVITGLISSWLLIGFLIIIYGLIARKVTLNNKQQARSGEPNDSQHSSKTQSLVVMNSGILIVSFILCSSPWVVLTTRNLLDGQHYIEENQFRSNIAHYIFVVNSLLDPFIYFFVSYYRKKNLIKGVP